jgi:hypothetical protein
MLGSFYVRDQVTIALEIHALLEKAEPGVFPPKGTPRWEGRKVALAERSTYYRELLKSYLESTGAEVLTHSDPDEATFAVWKTQGVDSVLTSLSPNETLDEGVLARIREGTAKSGLPLVVLKRVDDARRQNSASQEDKVVKLGPSLWSKYTLLAQLKSPSAQEVHHA